MDAHVERSSSYSVSNMLLYAEYLYTQLGQGILKAKRNPSDEITTIQHSHQSFKGGNQVICESTPTQCQFWVFMGWLEQTMRHYTDIRSGWCFVQFQDHETQAGL